jgi:GTP-binding protein
MFIDQVKLKLIAGKGGNGIIAWRREKFIPKGGPSGGDGGKGGSIILESSTHFFALDKYRHATIFRAQNGGQGGSNGKQGKNGEDLILKVPCGTIVKDLHTGQTIIDFTEPNQRFVLCQGGIGGRGNESFKTPTHQAPYIATDGKEGEEIEVELELKLIADVGFVGMPNAGKSTLLSELTTAKVKIGNYPFTTLVPNLSFIEYDDFSRVYLADIPGIIRGAHVNKGLGLAFLKHIERSAVLVYVVDISGFENRDPIEDFKILQAELALHDQALMEKPFVIALNKIDEEGAEDHLVRFKEAFPQWIDHCFPLSALTGVGLDRFKMAIKELAQQVVVRYV